MPRVETFDKIPIHFGTLTMKKISRATAAALVLFLLLWNTAVISAGSDDGSWWGGSVAAF